VGGGWGLKGLRRVCCFELWMAERHGERVSWGSQVGAAAYTISHARPVANKPPTANQLTHQPTNHPLPPLHTPNQATLEERVYDKTLVKEELFARVRWGWVALRIVSGTDDCLRPRGLHNPNPQQLRHAPPAMRPLPRCAHAHTTTGC